MCSMISGQSDKLRAAAQACRSLGRHEMEQTLLDAADLILELRDNLQCANEAVRDAEHDESMAWDRVRKAEAESEKLRWLVRHLYEYRQLYFKTGIYPTDHGVTEQYMRELGVEVEDE